MGTLYLVRHGQASFGEDDYDKLSELGHRQSRRLGEYFAAKGLHFDAVVTGTLRRHTETFQGIAQGMGLKADVLQWPGLNEYDSEAVISAVYPHKLEKPTSPEMYRHHFRLLRDGLTSGWRAWSARAACPATTGLYGRHQRAGPCARPAPRQPTCCWSPAAGRSPPPWAMCWAPARDHHRAQPAHPQQQRDRVRLHAQAAHAGDLQHLAAPGRCAYKDWVTYA
jgi:hypothetical protein